MCPYRSRCNHRGYRYPQHRQFFYWGFLTATSVVPLGWMSGRMQERLLIVTSNGELVLQRDLQWASEILAPGSPSLPLSEDRAFYRRLLQFDRGANKNSNLTLKDWHAGMQSYPQRMKQWPMPQPVFSVASFKRKHHLQTTHYTLSVFMILHTQWNGDRPGGSIPLPSMVSNVLKGGLGLTMSLLNITQQWWVPNAAHKDNLLIFNPSECYKDTSRFKLNPSR